MAEQEIVNNDTPNVDGANEVIEEIQDDNSIDWEFLSDDEKKTLFEKTKETNKKLYARAKKAESAKKEPEPSQKTEPKEKQTNNNPVSDEKLARLELKVDGYSDKEIDFILQNGGKEALQNELVASAIETMRAKEKSKAAAIDGSAKSPIYKKYTEEQIRNMSAAEMEKILPRDENSF